MDTAHPDGSGRRLREWVGADRGRPFLWEADTTEARLCAGKDPLAGAGFCFMFLFVCLFLFFTNVFLFPLVLKIFKFLKRRDCF